MVYFYTVRREAKASYHMHESYNNNNNTENIYRYAAIYALRTLSVENADNISLNIRCIYIFI